NSTAATAAEHNLVVELPSDVASNAKDVKGNFPLRGETFKVAVVTSGIITISYRSVNPSQVQVGDKGVVIGKFELNANSTEDQTLYSATFEQNSSASDADFTNIAIRRTDGTILTNTVAQTVGDFVTLVFDPPFTILEGDKISLEIVGDIMNGADKSIQMHFEESSDLFAVGSLYGYGINGQLYGSQVTIPSDNATTVTIDAGEFTIGVNGPATTQYTSDTNDAVFANIDFSTGGEDVDIKNMYITIFGQTSTGAYMCSNGGARATACTTADTIANMMEGVEIRNKTTGRTVTGVRMTTTGTSGNSATALPGQFQIYRFDDFVIKGKESWQFRVDFTSNAGGHPRNGDKFKINICGEPTHILSAGSLIANTTTCTFGGVFGAGGTVTAGVTTYQMAVEGLSTGDKVGDVRPRGNIAGNFQEVVDASLTVAVKALSETDSAVENSKDINLLRFEAKASSAEDLLLTKGVFEAAGAATADNTLQNASNYALWVDTDGDRKVDTILEDGVASQSSQVSFTDLAGGGYVLPKEQTVVFEVHGDVASSLQTNATLQLRFATGSTVTYIEAEKLADGSSLSGLKLNGTCSGSCDTSLSTAASTIWTLTAQGDLYVTRDSVIGPRQLLGGTLGESVLKLKFHAEYEDIDVTDLVLNSTGGTAGSVDSVELWLDGGTKAIAVSGGCGSADVLVDNNGAPAGAGTGTTAFCFTMDSKQLVVPRGSDVKVNVRPRMKTDVQGGASAQVIGFFIDSTPASNDGTGTGSVRARGVASSNNLIANNADTTADGEVFIGLTSAAAANIRVIGSYNQAVLSKIATITNGGAAAGTVPSGDSDVGAFTFTAAANSNSKDGLNQASISGAVFTVQATNVSLTYDGFKIYNKVAGSTQNAACTTTNTAGVAYSSGNVGSGTFLVRCVGLIAGGVVNTAIDQGGSITLVLRANVTTPNAAAGVGGTSLLQVSLNNFSDVTKKSFGAITGESRIQWQDKDSNATLQRFSWVEYPDTSVNSTKYDG
ncbi:MAG: hypothetical protein PHE68_05095, partial [Candidatus Peribacteraceae bacterium]|nr:hypothetical protein [Candidatus Peribacteraceae bacterium]